MISPLPIERVFREAVEANVKSLGITYVELGRRSGVKVGTVRNMLNYQTRGSIRVWQKLLTAAEVELGWRKSTKENA